MTQDSKQTLYCSFCGKSQHEVKKLIAGPSVFVCNECVELCNDIISEEEQAEQTFVQQNPNVTLTNAETNQPYQALVSQFVAQIMQQVVQLGSQIQQSGQPQQQGPDPLIQLKQQELQLRSQQEQNDVAREQQEIELERQKLAQRESNFQQRLASQEAQTQARIDAGIERELLKQRGDQ